MFNWTNFLSQLFNGLVLGALLALTSSGLTIIYGTLGVLNLAHGAMFMLGGYAGYVAYEASGSFLVAVIAATLFMLIFGVLLERLIIRHFYDRPDEDQLLVTFGLSICIVEIVRYFFSSMSKSVPPPSLFSGITSMGGVMFPTYRLALIGIVAVALLALYLVFGIDITLAAIGYFIQGKSCSPVAGTIFNFPCYKNKFFLCRGFLIQNVNICKAFNEKLSEYN